MSEIVVVPLSYLEYQHQESVCNSHYSNAQKVAKQEAILKKLKNKGGVGEDSEVAMKKRDLEYFTLS